MGTDRLPQNALLLTLGGLTVAEVLGLSTTMVEREWGRARAWLALRLE
ncbi:MAG: hypothetical protein AAFZ65_04090 [Planctomycetota bacterium]